MLGLDDARLIWLRVRFCHLRDLLNLSQHMQRLFGFVLRVAPPMAARHRKEYI
jgi:hypothetical protein